MDFGKIPIMILKTLEISKYPCQYWIGRSVLR